MDSNNKKIYKQYKTRRNDRKETFSETDSNIEKKYTIATEKAVQKVKANPDTRVYSKRYSEKEKK